MRCILCIFLAVSSCADSTPADRRTTNRKPALGAKPWTGAPLSLVFKGFSDEFVKLGGKRTVVVIGKNHSSDAVWSYDVVVRYFDKAGELIIFPSKYVQSPIARGSIVATVIKPGETRKFTFSTVPSVPDDAVTAEILATRVYGGEFKGLAANNQGRKLFELPTAGRRVWPQRQAATAKPRGD